MLHPWMTVDEAIARLEGFRDASLAAAEVSNPDWILDRVPDAAFKVTPFDQNAVFASALDVVAFDLALQIVRDIAERQQPRELIEGEWTAGGNSGLGL